MDKLVKWHKEMLDEHGWYLHYVPNDTQAPNDTNCHTHGLFENFGHPDLQICFPLHPDLAHQIIATIVSEIKKGARFEQDRTYLGILENEYPIRFIQAVECGRKVLRALIPDEQGGYGAPMYKEQLTMLNNGMALETLHYDPEDIKTVADVARFFLTAGVEYKLAFHPDTPFEDYVRTDDTRVFTDSQANRLNGVLDKCFELCKARNHDIYEIALGIDSLRRKASIQEGRARPGRGKNNGRSI